MARRVEISKRAERAIGELDKSVAKRMLDELEEVSSLKDPRSRGRALTGNLPGLWRYRVGDYRIICDIEDKTLVILVIEIAHRSKAYKS